MGLYYFESRIDGHVRGLTANSVDDINIARGHLEFTYGVGNVLGLEAIPRGEIGQQRLNALMDATRAKQGVAGAAAVSLADRGRPGYIPNPFVPNHNPVTSTSPAHSVHTQAQRQEQQPAAPPDLVAANTPPAPETTTAAQARASRKGGTSASSADGESGKEGGAA